MGYTFAAGMPHVRINLARRFAENKGYDILISVFSNPLFKWTSAEVFMHILKLLHVQEVRVILFYLSLLTPSILT